MMRVRESERKKKLGIILKSWEWKCYDNGNVLNGIFSPLPTHITHISLNPSSSDMCVTLTSETSRILLAVCSFMCVCVCVQQFKSISNLLRWIIKRSTNTLKRNLLVSLSHSVLGVWGMCLSLFLDITGFY